MNLIKVANNNSPIKPGTFFKWKDQVMANQSSHSYNNERPMVVIGIENGVAYCCPTSAVADGWNELNDTHCIPFEVNPAFMYGKDSHFALNRVYDNGWTTIPVKDIRGTLRINLPNEFAEMCIQLLDQFKHDKKVGKLNPNRFGGPLKYNRKKSLTKRVQLTMQDIMVTHFPTPK